LKGTFQEAEDHLWKRFPWAEEVLPDIFINTELREDMKINEDLISASFKSEVQGVSEKTFAKPLRYIEPEFDPESDKDV